MGNRNDGCEIIRLCLNTLPDFRGRYGGSPRFGISIEDLVKDRCIEKYFITPSFISYRDLFNNLDGDDRVMTGVEGRTNAGSLALLASANYIQCWLDEEVDERNISEIANKFEGNELNDLFDSELPELLIRSMDMISSYLFGRVVLTERFAIDNPEVYETMYQVCEDLLWLICSDLAHNCDGIENIIAVAYTNHALYPVARWEVEYLDIRIINSMGVEIPEETKDTLLIRGMIDEQRLDSLHKRRH